MSYRADIDGLRAIAVVSVLLFHYGFAGAPGGFIGVDVFFVISGYLITSILAHDIADGRFSVLNFYRRRIRRIMPALIAMLLITTAFGCMMLAPGDYVTFARSALFAAFGASNFFFFANTGYFDRAAEFMPLLHTWSLGVEEQFYVVWPALFAGLVAVLRRRTWLIAAISTVTIVSFATTIWTIQFDPKAAFYFPHTRAWELALGAILVFVPAAPYRVGEAANALGLGLIVAGLLTISIAQPFPNWNALLPCLGSALVIWPKLSITWTGRALGALRGGGLISYSLYLWHWPVWVYYRLYINSAHPTPVESVAVASIAVMLAVLSYIFVETPIRRMQRPTAISAGAAAAGTVAVIALAIIFADGLTFRIPASRVTMRSLEEMWRWDCTVATIDGAISNTCVFGSPWNIAKTKAVIWGDSHAAAAAPLLEPFARDAEASFILHLNCPAVLDGTRFHRYFPEAPAYRAYCAENRAAMISTLKRHPEISLVVLSAAWPYFPGIILSGEQRSPDPGAGVKLFEESLDTTLKEIAAPGRRIVILGIVPQWPPDGSFECAYSDPALWRVRCPVAKMAIAQAQSRQTESVSAEIITRAAARNPGTLAIFPAEPMCAAGSCLVELNGEPLYYDPAHIRRNLREDTRRKLGRIMGFDRIFENDKSLAADPR
jgi:peptidoglycan/LPS O-acetylase OafA/YrhL